MKTPSATPQPAPQAKAAKPSLAEQIAASKAQGGKPPVAAPSSVPKAKQPAVSETPEEISRAAEVRAALVKEWKELWKDRTSRIVLLGTAGTIALGIAGGAALYSRKPVEPKKKTDPAALVEKEAAKLRIKREEIATTGQLKVSTNPEDMKATMDALKEWSRQDAESARAKASKR